MITRALRWLSRLDRSYFFAISSLISAIVVSVTLAFAPIVQAADGNDISLVARDGAVVFVLLILPLMVLATPLLSLPQNPAPIERSHKINASAATFILFAFVGISLSSFGLFYVPSLIFSIASSISLFFGRKRKLVQQESPGRPRGEDGIRLSRGGLKRLREQERLAAEANATTDDASEPQGESPLESSRRRRGRNRRKR